MTDEMKKQLAKHLYKLQRSEESQSRLSDTEFKRLFDEALEQASNAFVNDSKHQIGNVFLLYSRPYDSTGDDPDSWQVNHVSFAEWPPAQGKQRAMINIGMNFAKEHPDRMLLQIIHISEAWGAQYHEEDTNPDDPVMLRENIPSPSQRDDKVEIIIAAALSMDHRLAVQTKEIVRDKSGSFVELRDHHFAGISLAYNPKKMEWPPKVQMPLSDAVFWGYFEQRKATTK